MTQEITNRNQYLKETLLLRKRIESNFLELGERLSVIRSQRLYEGQFQTFAEFCFEVKISESTASRLIAVYQKYCVEYGMNRDKLAAVSWSSLYQLLPVATDKKAAEDAIAETKEWKREDISKFVKEKTSPELAKCKHSNSYLLRICNDCGERTRVYED